MEKLKFTQEIKDNWLEALKSGNYTQGYGTLVEVIHDKKRHCCIGVLGDIHPDLANFSSAQKSPYIFLDDTIGENEKTKLWKKNDSFDEGDKRRPENYKDDYSNVIPLIEALEIQE